MTSKKLKLDGRNGMPNVYPGIAQSTKLPVVCIDIAMRAVDRRGRQ
jgi:hypothetical protein